MEARPDLIGHLGHALTDRSMPRVKLPDRSFFDAAFTIAALIVLVLGVIWLANGFWLGPFRNTPVWHPFHEGV